MKAVNTIRMGGVELLPLIEGGKGIGVKRHKGETWPDVDAVRGDHVAISGSVPATCFKRSFTRGSISNTRCISTSICALSDLW